MGSSPERAFASAVLKSMSTALKLGVSALAMLFASNSARCARSDKACAWMPSALSRSKAIFTPIEIRHGLAKANGMPYVDTALHRVKARLKSAHGSGRAANVCRTLPLALHVLCLWFFFFFVLFFCFVCFFCC